MNYLNSALGRLVSFRNIEDFEIIGVLFQNEICNDNEIAKHYNQTIVIHIHGSYGNFYQNKFIWYMSNIYCRNGIDLLSINTSSHDGLAEGYYGKNLKYVGGGVADYKDSQFDIQAAVDFASFIGYSDIILQGHSLGCNKVIDYSINSSAKNDIILLSPVDSYAVQSDWIKPEKIEDQITRIQNGVSYNEQSIWGSAEFDWLNNKEYGAHGDSEDWVYEIPVTRKTLVSILTSSAFKYLNLSMSPAFYADVNAIAYIGRKDGLLFCTPEKMANYLCPKFKTFLPIIDLEADHDIVGVEEALVKRIVSWIQSRK